MAELIERIPQPDGGVREIYDDGREIVKDADGKFAPGGTMPASTAREITKGRTTKKLAGKSEDVDSVLAELGLDADSVTNRSLAEQFLDRKTGSVGAIRELFRKAGTYADRELTSGGYIRLGKNERCPTCGHTNVWMEPEVAERVIDILFEQKVRREREAAEQTDRTGSDLSENGDQARDK